MLAVFEKTVSKVKNVEVRVLATELQFNFRNLVKELSWRKNVYGDFCGKLLGEFFFCIRK